MRIPARRLARGGAGHSAALGSKISAADVCSYVRELTCFDGQRTTVLSVSLAGDGQLSLWSGSTGELLMHGAE